jgi:hypothetical protein
VSRSPTAGTRSARGKEEEPLRAEDYEQLHHEFPKYTFATLWAVIHEFDKD